MTDVPITDHAGVTNAMLPEDSEELRELYRGFEREHLIPLWTQLDDLMPMVPQPKALPWLWRWMHHPRRLKHHPRRWRHLWSKHHPLSRSLRVEATLLAL